MTIELQPGGRFGNSLAVSLEKHQMSLGQLAAETDSTYEHIRKLVKGLAFPSRRLLKDICRILKFDAKEAQLLIDTDKLEYRFGENVHTIMHTSARLAEYDSLVPYLTEDQHQMFLTQMRAVVKANRTSSRRTG